MVSGLTAGFLLDRQWHSHDARHRHRRYRSREEKLRSGSDPARRRSKRLQDLADAQSLLENTQRWSKSRAATSARFWISFRVEFIAAYGARQR